MRICLATGFGAVLSLMSRRSDLGSLETSVSSKKADKDCDGRVVFRSTYQPRVGRKGLPLGRR